MRILRILRLVRVIRVVRVLRLIQELRTIVVSVLGSLRSLCWTVVLLMLLIYVVAVYFTQSVTDYRVMAVDSTSNPEDMQVLNDNFSSLLRSVLSLYQSISGGVDWGALCDPLISEIS